MNLSPEIKQQLAEQKKQCIFCKLISGEIPNAKKVFEDDKTIALLDIYPAVKGHTLFMLKEHYPMPAYVSPEDFTHKFSLLPGLSQAIKAAIVRTGMSVFMAMGGAAGQQSYHFMVHLLPREPEDKFFNFLLKKNSKPSEEDTKLISDLMQKVLLPSSKGEIPSFLAPIAANSTILYQDEKLLCVLPIAASAKGQVSIYSKTEEKYIEKISQQDCAHLFYVASQVSKVVFEALRAQGTNILLFSGESDDNTSGTLAIHILPRWQDDNLSGLLWEPKKAAYDLDDVASKIKDKTWNIKIEKRSLKEIKTELLPAKSDQVKLVKINAEKELINAIALIRGK
ncbi:MAG TPA: HIT domain-containing protein [Candidatus Nanoarchaeia archaeon]|nr:HIT domain-containing protein [Candidatus Nanoarchaeia archaeon]